MEVLCAVFEVTLDTSSTAFIPNSADRTGQLEIVLQFPEVSFHSCRIFQFSPWTYVKPDMFMVVNAGQVEPAQVCMDNGAFLVGTQLAAQLIWHHPPCITLTTPLAMPIARRHCFVDFSTVARLMHANVACIAQDNLVCIVLFAHSAYIARDILIVVVFMDVDWLDPGFGLSDGGSE